MVYSQSRILWRFHGHYPKSGELAPVDVRSFSPRAGRSLNDFSRNSGGEAKILLSSVVVHHRAVHGQINRAPVLPVEAAQLAFGVGTGSSSDCTALACVAPNTKKHHIHSISRAYSIRPRRLIVSMTVHKIPSAIDFKAPENIFRVRYPSKIRRMPVIVDVDVTSPSSTAHASLTICAPGSVSTSPGSSTVARALPGASPLPFLREERSTRPKVRATRRSHRLRLGLDVGIFVGVDADDGVEYVEEFMVLRQ